MTGQTHSSPECAKKIKTIIENSTLTFEDIWYIDSDLVPRTPAAVVEPGDVDRELSGTTYRTHNSIEVNVILYLSRLNDIEGLQHEVDTLADDTASVINQNETLDGLVTHGFVQNVAYGHAVRGKVLLRAAMLTWVGTSITFINP